MRIPARGERSAGARRGERRRDFTRWASLLRRLRDFHRQEAGLVTLEHVLIMAAFVFPMYLVMMVMLRRLGEYYGLLTFFGSLPFF